MSIQELALTARSVPKAVQPKRGEAFEKYRSRCIKKAQDISCKTGESWAEISYIIDLTVIQIPRCTGEEAVKARRKYFNHYLFKSLNQE